MTSEPARKLDPEQQHERQKERVLFDYGNAAVNYRNQITDLNRYFADKWNGRRPDVDAAYCDAAIELDQLAVYLDGPERIDRFFESETIFNTSIREQLKREALARAPNARSQSQLGKAIGLTWETRKRLGIRNIDAIDKPPAAVLKAEKNVRDGASRKRRCAERSSMPKPLSTAKRQAAELLNRRLAAILAAVGHGKPVRSICKILRKLKHSPFIDVKEDNLPRVVRRLIEHHAVGLLVTDLREISGRPDLRRQLWAIPVKQPKGEPKLTISQQPLPANPEEYRSYLAEHLARLETVKDLSSWYHSKEQVRLRKSCGIAPKVDFSDGYAVVVDEFMAMAIARRSQLLGRK